MPKHPSAGVKTDRVKGKDINGQVVTLERTQPRQLSLFQTFLSDAYSTEFCHPVRRKVATQSTAKLPLNPQESCHPVHGISATRCTAALPLSERSDAGGVHD